LLEFIKERKGFIILVATVLVVIVIVIAKINSNGEVETVSPVSGDLVRIVKISGKVTPQESADLSFETSGTVVSISKEVGQTVRRGDLLVRIDASNISADILKAEAELSLAQANLDKLEGAGVYEAQIENAKRGIAQTIVDSYTTADDAVYNKTDQLFRNPRSGKPEISYAFKGYEDLRDDINLGRVSMEEILNDWETLVTGLTLSTYTDNHLTKSREYLSLVSSYISNVARAVNLFEANDNMSQATLDGYKSDVLSARDNLNSASQNLITAEDKLKNLLLDVPVQVARVEAARATLLNSKSQLSKTYLTSPINGIVSRQDAKVGQVVSSAVSIVSVISRELEVEAYIPEVLISGVAVGNPATITLDAYSEKDTFEARVRSIDPAETIRDGVSTYKVKLAFSIPDNRIRSGMTANINIETFRKNGLVLIPERTVIREGDETFIYILSGDNKEKTPITIGEKDSTGNVELVTELPLDSKLIINPTQN